MKLEFKMQNKSSPLKENLLYQCKFLEKQKKSKGPYQILLVNKPVSEAMGLASAQYSVNKFQQTSENINP